VPPDSDVPQHQPTQTEARHNAGPLSFPIPNPIHPNQTTPMAIKLIANYSKRLGLPGFSSHQFSVSVETELVSIQDIPTEAERLYQTLQSNVDEQIQQTGFVPDHDYGMDPASGPTQQTGKDSTSKPSAETQANQWRRGPAWKCSDKQRDLVLKLVEEHRLDKNDVEALAQERFGKGVRLLNKVEASGLIDELLETHGGGNHSQDRSRSRGKGSAYSAGQQGRRAA